MSSWIEKQAEQIKAKEAKDANDQRWALHAAEQVKAHWRPIWDNIKSAIEDDVTAFNAQFSDPNQRITIVDESEDGLGLTLRREAQAVAVYVVQVRAFPGEGVRVWIIETNHSRSGQSKNEERFAFNVRRETGEVVALDGGTAKTPPEMAEAILRGLFR